MTLGTTPKVVKIQLSKQYRFMYENFVVATQSAVYLMLEKTNDTVNLLCFNSWQLKYGSPNDEARGGHPLWQFGMGFYGFYEVLDSPWIHEQMVANRVHDKHLDSHFKELRHFIACFKDVMVEVTCRSFDEQTMSVADFNTLIRFELEKLTD